jgi:2-methylcitrate dehydratase PrpD
MTFKNSSLSSHAYGPLFGGGYAAGALLRFNEEQFRILLNYLAQEASGLTAWRLDQRHTLKSYVFGGMPASNAVKAAAIVRAGFTGAGPK